jgi:hypothetical protein
VSAPAVKARSARKTGPAYRTERGRFQTYTVVMSDGTERRAEVSLAYGRQSAAVAKLQAEGGAQ